jgi:hypothetical protein
MNYNLVQIFINQKRPNHDWMIVAHHSVDLSKVSIFFKLQQLPWMIIHDQVGHK